MPILFIFAFLGGMCTIFSPCILPVIPVVLAAGASKGRLRPLGVTLGLIVSFTFFTAALSFLVHSLGISATMLRYLAIGCLALFGLCMVIPSLSLKVSSLLSPLARAGEGLQKTGSQEGFWGGFILGVSLGLLWTPCAGPILAAITTFIATRTAAFSMIGLAFLYVLGAAIPLYIIAWGGSRMMKASTFLSAHQEGVRRFFGCVTIFVALSVALHWDVTFEQKVGRFVPSIVVEDNRLVQGQLGVLQKEIQESANEEIPSGGVPYGYNPYGRAPELTGLTNWINSTPLSLEQLKRKVVLLDFWTYSCVNCLRTLPYVEGWYQKYKEKGLVVIGIHTPEFEFEKDPKNVEEAVSRLGITYPVALDNNYKVWNAYHNHFWPAHYLIDQTGNIVLVHFGEGGYAEMEDTIRSLVQLPQVSFQEPTASKRSISPEIYLGVERGKNFTSENRIVPYETILYAFSQPLKDNEVGLKGYWQANTECITSEDDMNTIEINFLGKQAYLVLSGSSTTPCYVFLDGLLVKEVFVQKPMKYDLVDSTYGPHHLSLSVPKGISAYAFTFGDE